MIVRRVAGVLAGLVVAVVVMLALEGLAHTIGGGRPATVEAMSLPTKLTVMAALFLGSLAGALVAMRVAQWRGAAAFVTGFVLAGAIANLFAIPHPLWMQVASVVLPNLALYVARRLGRVHSPVGRGVPA